MKTYRFSLFAFVFLVLSQAQAEVSFVSILQALTTGKKNIVTEVPELNRLMQAQNIQEAQSVLQNKSLADFQASSAVTNATEVGSLLGKRVLTVVIVPGVLGEFIETRAFEEVFAKESSFKTEFNNLVTQKKAVDSHFDVAKMDQVSASLSELINAASIDDKNGKPLLKVIILKTLLGSLESVSDNQSVAAVFNRRIQKYVNLTKDQDLVLLGYSRGTPLALEMVTQAEAQKISYIKNVKALVSYAGVVSGSSLADVTADKESDNGKLFAAAIELHNDLQTADSFLDRIAKRAHNTKAFAKFALAAGKSAQFDPQALLTNARSGDFKTIAALIMQMSGKIGLDSPTDFNGHVIRTKKFIKNVLTAVMELRTVDRLKWWRSHQLPRNIKYYSIAASMVDPENGAQDKAIFDAGEGYNNSLDDQSLIANMRAYVGLTNVSMNDSQVALYQSLFLPKVISSLNAANAGLDMKSLGVLQTHHWGVSLRVVNKMKDGRLNPFPREKVLLSLAAYLNQ